MTAWNEYDKSSTIFISGGLTASSLASTAGAVRSTDAVNVGKLYLEFQGIGEAVGLTVAGISLGGIGAAGSGLLIYQFSGNVVFNGITQFAFGAVGSETIGIAVDFAASRAWVRLNNGLWNNSGTDNPATGTGGINVAALFPGNPAYAVATFASTERTATVNFGANTFAYAAPSGFAGWYAPPEDGSADAGLTRTLAALTLNGFGGNIATGPTGPGAHRYWRFQMNASAAAAYAFTEVQFRTTAGSSLAFSGGTASAAQTFGGTPGANDASKAADGNTSTIYSSIDKTAPQWWAYDYGAGNSLAIVQIAITARSDGNHNQAPTSITPEWSDDGSAWTATPTVTASTWTSGQTQVFSTLTGVSDARVTQVALEMWAMPLADAQLTQVALELWGSVATTTVGTGALTATFGTATLAATGVLSTPSGPNAGRLEPFTFASATLVATGTLVNHGVLDQTLAPLVLNPPGEGVEKYGELTATLVPLTLAGIGTAVSGRLDAILGALTLAGTGGVAKRGKLEDRKPLAGLTLSGHGALANRGVLGGMLGPVRMLALGGLSSVAPGTPGVVSQQTFFFAWTNEAAPFDSSMLREDEQVFGFELTHEEGDFPTLRLDLKNPRVGLLAAGRNVWCWFSWRDPASGLIEPLLHGRLIGIPEDIAEEVVRLQFVARPSNYIAWKQIVAEGLKVRPFWDPVWISEGEDDPDTVLEARPAAWHIDRTSLAVTASDTIIGEDGTLPITEDDHFYDGLKVGYGDTPLKSVAVSGTVTWNQQGTDVVDLTQQVWQQFQYAGSPYDFPMVASFTGDGLLSSWPQPGANIGGGWSMDATAVAVPALWQSAWLKSIVYVRPVLSTETEVLTPGQFTYSNGLAWKPAVTREREYVSAHETVATIFPLIPLAITFNVRWEASRARTEIVRFAMTSDTQDLLVDPGDDETDKLDLSSDFVSQGVDPGGALPIGDLRRNSYFNTDRGNQSVEYLIMLARAKMLSRARAVNLTVETPFGFATRLSCRWNATVFDPRLPGGQGTGKVTRYVLSADGDSGELKAEITVACTVGRGNTVTPDAGEATYGDGYTDEYQAVDGATLDAGTGDIVYESFDGMTVVDDDDLDLFRMTPDRILRSLVVANGPDVQQNTLDSFYRNYTPPGIEQKPPEIGVPVGTYVAPETPTQMLSKMPTTVALELAPISGQSFLTEWEPEVSALMIPRTIDLEAPYV